jgi:hypothetical protein
MICWRSEKRPRSTAKRMFVIRSAGAVFPVMPMARLEAARLTDTGSPGAAGI